MKIQVRLFAAARQLVGQDHWELECGPEPTVGRVREALETAFPALAPLMPFVRFAVNADYVPDDTPLTEHDDVACIPPVSGG